MNSSSKVDWMVFLKSSIQRVSQADIPFSTFLESPFTILIIHQKVKKSISLMVKNENFSNVKDMLTARRNKKADRKHSENIFRRPH